MSEDPLAMAERHVREGEERVRHLAELLQRAWTEEGERALRAVEETLELAREHLRIERERRELRSLASEGAMNAENASKRVDGVLFRNVEVRERCLSATATKRGWRWWSPRMEEPSKVERPVISPLNEVEARALLWPLQGLEGWIAEQLWWPTPTGWEVVPRLGGWRFNLIPAPSVLHLCAWMPGVERPAEWQVSR
ncbi:hypothetical protein [Paracraurococcus lichenis]|uniref:Uncharacterized protein n=1 Tax=Paracraurococcus lichenis TaxID=3064888 RepID=A0ABT9EB71_9PROT|nr:hypothetical protein [Paracraurococcus sp. LOR1-02]MDO9713458.1 hypothetical protein [Paracraurococcus sp. LOR1-02]